MLLEENQEPAISELGEAIDRDTLNWFKCKDCDTLLPVFEGDIPEACLECGSFQITVT